MEFLKHYIAVSESIPGWTRGEEAESLARFVYELGDNPVVVELGCFLGSGTVLMAGARKERGSGQVYCVDPFDCSGDAFSTPFYRDILRAYSPFTPRQIFLKNLKRCGLQSWASACPGTADSVGSTWNKPVDFLFMDGDQSRRGALAGYLAWLPHLKSGAILALHNSVSPMETEDHDGHRQLVREFVHTPDFEILAVAGSITFARRRN